MRGLTGTQHSVSLYMGCHEGVPRGLAFAKGVKVSVSKTRFWAEMLLVGLKYKMEAMNHMLPPFQHRAKS